MLHVQYLVRRARQHGNYSVESVFQSVWSHLDHGFAAEVHVSRFESSGVLRRLYNVIEAGLTRGDLFHVTGDTHFLCYLLPSDRTILTIHDCGRIEGPPDWRKRTIKLLWFTLPVHHCAAITVTTQAGKQDLLRHVAVDPDKIHVIPVAVPELYERFDKPFEATRPRILQIGSAPNKNRERLFEALEGIPCELDIIGPLSVDQQHQLDQLGVAHTNHSNLSEHQLLQHYQNCDLLAFPSTFEGFGMPIIEAQRVGRPVLAGDTPTMREVAGEAASFVDPQDIASIRQGIEQLIADSDYRAALVERGFKNAERFDPRQITQQYEALYRQVWSKAKPKA